MIPSQRGIRVARGWGRSSADSAGIPPRVPVWAVLSLALALGFPALPLRGDEASGDPLPEDLRLGEAAREKAKALGLYYKGLMLEASLRIPEQIACYREVLRLDPANTALAMETANLCAAYGRFQEARNLLEENLALNPGRPRAHLNLSEFCETYADGDEAMAAEALSIAEEAQRAFPTDAHVCGHLAGLLLARGMRAEAGETFERTLAVAAPLDDPALWLRLAGIALRVFPDERDRINALFFKTLDLARGNLAIAKSVGDHFSTTRQYPEARQTYEAIIAAHPDALEVRERLVHVLRGLGEDARALETLEALVAIDPVNEQTRALLAEFYRARGESTKAIAEFEHLLRLKDGNIEDYDQLADQMIGAELYQGAERLLARARLRFPTSPLLSRKLAIVYSHLDRHAEALAQWDQTAALAERHGDGILTSDFYHYYGAAADAAKEHARAADYFRKAIDLVRASGDESGAAKSLNFLGYMWLEQNINVEAAGELIRRAIALEPDAPEYIDSLGWFHFRGGRFGKALDTLLEAEKRLPEPDPVVFDHIGQTYRELGRNAEAIRYFHRALELEPGNTEIQARLKTLEAQASPPANQASPAAADSTPPAKDKAA